MEKRHISVFALPEIKDDVTAFMDASVQQLLADVKVCMHIFLYALQRWFVNVMSFVKLFYVLLLISFFSNSLSR